MRNEPRYALDTEFHGERSYWPRLALIQLAWPGGIALIDPLTVDPAPLGELLAGPGCMVAHAADQDLAILERACGKMPSRLFDTQVAAGFIGLGTASLASAVERMLGTRLAKGDRLTDWTRRPFARSNARTQRPTSSTCSRCTTGSSNDSRRSAGCSGRSTSARNGAGYGPVPSPRSPGGASRARVQLRGTSRGVAQAVAAWRERAAEALDVPPRYVLSELALAGSRAAARRVIART